MKTRIAYLFVFLGGLITVLGGVFIGMYIWEAIISRMGEPDQSLIFWYLPILFIGITLLGMAVYFILIGFRSLKGKESDYRLAKNSLIILTGCFFILLVIWILKSIFA